MCLTLSKDSDLCVVYSLDNAFRFAFENHPFDDGGVVNTATNQFAHANIVHIKVVRILGTDIDTCLSHQWTQQRFISTLFT